MAMNSQSLSKEQVLIVGCGDIGRRLAASLPQDLYAVTGLRRNPPPASPFVTYEACDVTDKGQLAQVLRRGFDVVVVTMTPAERSNAGYERAYVQVCRNLVESLQSAPRLLIFVSSSAVYAQMDGGWVNESSPAEPESFSGKRLLEAESIIQNSAFASTIVRFSGIYGPNRNRLIEQVRRGKASASTHFTNRIHADDCARSLAHLIELNRQGEVLQPVYLASDSSPVPMLEVVTWLAGQMGVKDFLSPEATNERGNKRCSNQRLLDSGFEFCYPNYREGYATVLAEL